VISGSNYDLSNPEARRQAKELLDRDRYIRSQDGVNVTVHGERPIEAWLFALLSYIEKLEERIKELEDHREYDPNARMGDDL